jgi:hypothetical protein
VFRGLVDGEYRVGCVSSASRKKDFWNTYDYANSAHAMRLLAIVSVVYSKSYVFVMRRIVVRRSPVHGRGVFALSTIPFGE